MLLFKYTFKFKKQDKTFEIFAFKIQVIHEE
jgi:hypothetical protein